MGFNPKIEVNTDTIDIEKAITNHPIDVSNGVLHWILKEAVPKEDFDLVIKRLSEISDEKVDRIIEDNLRLSKEEISFVKKELKQITRSTP